jgi:hypothetical protein
MSGRAGFTVLIAAKNAEATIGRALTSIRDEGAQVVLIDHASADRTVEIARDLGGRALRVVSGTQLQALGAVRQAGLALAPTRFAAWLDADDEFLPGRIERLSKRLEHGDVGAVADATILCAPDGSERLVPLPEWTSRSPVAARLFERNWLPAIGLIGFKVEIWRSLAYDAALHGAEDVDIALRGVAHGLAWGWIDEPGTRVHVRPESLSRRRDNQRAMYARALKKHPYPVVQSRYCEAGWDAPTTSWGLASMALFRGEGEPALGYLDDATRCGVNGWPMAFTRGAAYLVAGNAQQAVSSLMVAEELEASPEGASNLGVAHAMLGASGEARRWFETAVSRFPDYQDARFNLSASTAWRITTHPLRTRL